jgi:Methyltransferase domain
MKCNVCLSEEVDDLISLENYPLNSLYLAKVENKSIEKYRPKNFSLYLCKDCSHFQAISGVKLDDLYNDGYSYNTKNSGVQGRIAFFLEQLNEVVGIRFNRVIDIGCYDLSLLKEVKKRVKADYFIGVDPSIPERCLNNEENIYCFKDYIDRVDLPYFKSELPDLVISDQTFEHIPSINSTLQNVVQKVGRNSIFAVCVPSMEVLIEKLNFHNLIHEHVNYFSISTLTKLFGLHNLSLRNYTLNYTSTCGFLFGIFIKSSGGLEVTKFEKKPINRDFFFKHYNLFKSLLLSSMEIIENLDDKDVYGFGASDITANLAYFMNSDFSFLKNILDDTEYKQNCYIPFLKPQIVKQDNGQNFRNANCLITSPQAARYIYTRINSLNFKRIINPIGLLS